MRGNGFYSTMRKRRNASRQNYRVKIYLSPKIVHVDYELLTYYVESDNLRHYEIVT